MTVTDIEQLKTAIRDELVSLWSDLHDAQVEGIRTDWSIRCVNVAERITELTKLVGPTPWDRVPITLLENGVYVRVHAAMGVEVRVDWYAVDKLRRQIDEQARQVSL